MNAKNKKRKVSQSNIEHLILLIQKDERRFSGPFDLSEDIDSSRFTPENKIINLGYHQVK